MFDSAFAFVKAELLYFTHLYSLSVVLWLCMEQVSHFLLLGKELIHTFCGWM